MATTVPFAVISLALRQLSGVYQGSASQFVPPELLAEGMTTATSDVVEVTQAAAPSLMDPSLTTGGMLWFTDLTAVDPYFVLPVLCSFFIWLNSMGRMSPQERRRLFSPEYMKKLKTRQQRARVGLARGSMIMPVFPLLFSGMPAAIFLYWLCTFGLNTVNDLVLNKVLPKKYSELDYRLELPTQRPFLVGKPSTQKTPTDEPKHMYNKT
jgi:inner membrane protein COX18